MWIERLSGRGYHNFFLVQSLFQKKIRLKMGMSVNDIFRGKKSALYLRRIHEHIVN
jgi:hypothetical protein